jgi:glycosyltransferase involved in cell wall biosynthesis
MRNVSSGPAKVVACVPAWRAASFIRPVLESLATQTYPNLHVLISVDACDDGTAELCEAFAGECPNVEVIRQSIRLGWVGNSNALIHRADGEYLFFAFHDDPIKPTYVSRLVEALEEHPNAVLAFCDMASDRGVERYSELEGVTDRIERAQKLLVPAGPWWVPHRGVFRADVGKRLGGLRRHLAGEAAADWPWLVSLALQGEFVRVPEVLIFKNRRPDGLNASFNRLDSAWMRLCIQLSCLREIRRARLPLVASVRLHTAGLLRFAREEWWQVQRTLVAAAGRQGPSA